MELHKGYDYLELRMAVHLELHKGHDYFKDYKDITKLQQVELWVWDGCLSFNFGCLEK